MRLGEYAQAITDNLSRGSRAVTFPVRTPRTSIPSNIPLSGPKWPSGTGRSAPEQQSGEGRDAVHLLRPVRDRLSGAVDRGGKRAQRRPAARTDHFTYDVSRCMFCGLCEDACPVDCLELTQDFELAQYSREGLIWDRQMLEEGPKPTGTSIKATMIRRRDAENAEKNERVESDFTLAVSAPQLK